MYRANDKLFIWASQLEDEARLQAERTARLPIIDRVALMPDAHFGMGATVGSVIGTRGAIIPAAVGVDIGCGMIAAELDMNASQLPDNLEAFMPLLAEAVPAGLGKDHSSKHDRRRHKRAQRADTWLRAHVDHFTSDLDQKRRRKILDQFGTLGSGNHFVEICVDEIDQVWVVLHSGSRGIGYSLAQDHIREAKRLCTEKGITLEDQDLAYLEEADAEFGLYIGDMLACQAYALANREEMLTRLLGEFRSFLGWEMAEMQRINTHHNFTEQEVHVNLDPASPDLGNEETVWVTRKGAVKADVGDLGIMPGSMGTETFIVEGLGEPISYHSCAHGAGRTMSRGRAKREHNEEDLVAMMEGKVWLHDSAKALLDEIPTAYKDVHQVMEDQADLVRPVRRLTQVLNYKGA